MDLDATLIQRIAEKTKLREAHLAKQRQHELATYSLTGAIGALKELLVTSREEAKAKADPKPDPVLKKKVKKKAGKRQGKGREKAGKE